jgi:dienelactone hydrolase
MAFSQYPRSVAGYNTMLHTPRWNGKGAGLRGIIVCHGHGGNALQAQQGEGFWTHPSVLADAGYAVMAVDEGATSWMDDACMTAITAAYNDLVSTVGITGTKVGLMGWSMGGGSALNWVKRNPTLAAAVWLWSPLTDLDWVHGTGGYTPAYATGGLTPAGGWATEIDTAYGGNYAANAPGHKVYDEPSTWANICPIKIAHATDDDTLPVAASTSFVANVNSTKVTLRTPDTTGGHQGSILAVPSSEVVGFFRDQWAA